MKTFKLSLIYSSLLASGLLLNPESAIAQNCVSPSLNTPIYFHDQSVLLDKCEANFNIKENHFYSSFINQKNGNVKIKNSNLTFNTEKSRGHSYLISLNNSTLNTENTNFTLISNQMPNMILESVNSTANLDSVSIISTYKDQNVINYRERSLFRGSDSDIKINNSNISIINDNRFFYLYKSNLTLSNSNLKAQGDLNLSNAMMDLSNSNATLTGNEFILSDSDELLNIRDGSLTLLDSSIKQNKKETSKELKKETNESFFISKALIDLDATFSKSTNATASNITITSEGSYENTVKYGAFYVGNNSNLTLNNANVTYPNDSESFLIEIYAGESGNINISNTHAKTKYGFLTTENTFDSTEAFSLNIKDSNLHAQKLFTLDGTFNIQVENSRLYGNAYKNNRFAPSHIDVNLTNTDWTIPNQSRLRNLQVNDSHIILNSKPENNIYSDLIIRGNLSGNGHFTLYSDLASEIANKIIVNGIAEGNHTITVNDSGNEPQYENTVPLVRTKAGDATFKLTGKDYINAGAYRYRLLKQDNDWVLTSKVQEPTPTEPVAPTETVKPTEPVTPVAPTETVQPTEPVTPVAPTETVKPAEPVKPVAPVETVKPAEPVKPVAPAETVQPAEPVTPVAPTETVQPTEPVAPVAPTETVKPAEPVTPVAPTETVQPTEPVTPVMPTETAKPIIPVIPIVPTETVKPVEPPKPTIPTEQLVLSEKSNALVSLRQAQLALVESSLEGLHHRLGELKNGEKGNVWVRNLNTRNDFASTNTAQNSKSSGFEQNIHTLQLGADLAISQNIRLGGFVGNARSDVDFKGEYGSGKVKSQSVGIYGTYLADNGFYLDNIAKYERVKAESDSTGKQKNNAYTLSSEIGRIHHLGQSWTITPQLQLAWTRLSGSDNEERLSAFTARAGVRVGKAIEFNDWKLQPYAELNAITTKTNNNAVRVNQYQFDVAESRERFQTALGINAMLGNHRIGLEGSVTNGKRLDQPYKIQAVYRYSW